jgi:hypothetical protein
VLKLPADIILPISRDTHGLVFCPRQSGRQFTALLSILRSELFCSSIRSRSTMANDVTDAAGRKGDGGGECVVRVGAAD